MTAFAVLSFILTLQSAMTPAFANDRLNPEDDYGRARIGGMKGKIKWESMLHSEGLEGWKPGKESVWSREGDTIIAKAGGNGWRNQTRAGRQYMVTL